MVYYSEHFKELEKKCNFPSEAVEALDSVAQRLDSEKNFGAEFEKIRKRYMFPKAHNLGKRIDELEVVAEKFGVEPYTLDLVFIVVCAELLHKRYKRAGLSDELFWAGCDDFRCKLLECMACKSVAGTFVASWNDGFFQMNRFALGRFQFEYGTFDNEDFKTSSGYTVKKGDKCINFHIPSSGIPLTDEVRLDSYKKAYKFFKNQRTKEGYLILRCGSWLLFPKHDEFLPKESNILKFAHDFEIFDWREKDDFGDAWRVFNQYAELPVEQYPEDTKLRRAFKKWLLDGNKTGYGSGVIVFDGEKIVR